MLLENALEKKYSLDIAGRVGFSVFYGSAFFGYSILGDGDSTAGIYNHKKTLKGRRVSRELMYWPTNPRTELQQTNRAKMTAGVLAWQALTADQKKIYNQTARGRRTSGYNLFLSWWLSPRNPEYA